MTVAQYPLVCLLWANLLARVLRMSRVYLVALILIKAKANDRYFSVCLSESNFSDVKGFP
jgi:hypothetical protein